MTCIVAIAQNGVVYMASDHAASDDKTGWILSRKEPKCFKVGQYAVAFTDSFRMGQILQYMWTPPKYTPTKTNSGLDKFMRTKFVDSVKAAFKEHGYARIINGRMTREGDQLVPGDTSPDADVVYEVLCRKHHMANMSSKDHDGNR